MLSASAGLARDKGLRSVVRRQLAAGEPLLRALHTAVEHFAGLFTQMGGLMAERVSDLHDIERRITAHLVGVAEPGVPTPLEPSVLLAKDLAPSDTALLDPAMVLALVLLPALAGDVSRADHSDRLIVLDGHGEGHPDFHTSTTAIGYLREAKESGKPFFIGCGFVKPHSPLCAPQEFLDMYPLDKIKLTPDFAPWPTVPPGWPRCTTSSTASWSAPTSARTWPPPPPASGSRARCATPGARRPPR